MVSLVMMALAFGVPKPPCSKCHVWQAGIDFPCFLEGTHPQISKFDDFLESQFEMAAEYLKIGIMATCTTQ